MRDIVCEKLLQDTSEGFQDWTIPPLGRIFMQTGSGAPVPCDPEKEPVNASISTSDAQHRQDVATVRIKSVPQTSPKLLAETFEAGSLVRVCDELSFADGLSRHKLGTILARVNKHRGPHQANNASTTQWEIYWHLEQTFTVERQADLTVVKPTVGDSVQISERCEECKITKTFDEAVKRCWEVTFASGIELRLKTIQLYYIKAAAAAAAAAADSGESTTSTTSTTDSAMSV